MSLFWGLLRWERRRRERRQGERRSADRGGPDRRRSDRRAAGAKALLVTMVAAATPLSAEADVFTRRNASGVIEATNLPDREGFKLAYRSKGPVTHSPGFRASPSNNRAYDAYIHEAAAFHGVDVALVRAVIQVESEFDPRAVSRAGARGLMQIMPSTAVRLGVLDSFDPRQNIFGGVRYLRILLDMFRGDVSLAVAGYNAGEHAVQRHNGIPPYRETQGYVRKILGLLGAPVALAAPPPAAAAPAKPPVKRSIIYKWQDSRGRVFLSDTPPQDKTPYVILNRQGDSE
jgi:soluble lytic murein transglycosylase-like protein